MNSTSFVAREPNKMQLLVIQLLENLTPLSHHQYWCESSFRALCFSWHKVCVKFQSFTHNFRRCPKKNQSTALNFLFLFYTSMLTCFPFLLIPYPFTRTEYKLNWIINARILPVNVLNFIRYALSIYLFIYLFVCVCVSACSRDWFLRINL